MNELLRWATAQDDVNPMAISAIGLIARLVFAMTLLMFFWNSAFTKFDGFMQLSDGAYIQIFPKAFEAAGYSASNFPFWRKLIVFFGSISEFVLPLMIVVGLFTRLSALGMIGFIVVMTLTDVFGHGVELGALFKSASAQNIIGVRMYWVFLLLILAVIGGGWASVDKLFLRRNK